jgi:hypothetical protein
MRFGSRKVPGELTVPREVLEAPGAQEVLRAWEANGRLTCTLLPSIWDDPAAWGLAVADIARHVANATFEQSGTDPSETLRRIQAAFNAEVGSPTDTPSGSFRPTDQS